MWCDGVSRNLGVGWVGGTLPTHVVVVCQVNISWFFLGSFVFFVLFLLACTEYFFYFIVEGVCGSAHTLGVGLCCLAVGIAPP